MKNLKNNAAAAVVPVDAAAVVIPNFDFVALDTDLQAIENSLVKAGEKIESVFYRSLIAIELDVNNVSYLKRIINLVINMQIDEKSARNIINRVLFIARQFTPLTIVLTKGQLTIEAIHVKNNKSIAWQHDRIAELKLFSFDKAAFKQEKATPKKSASQARAKIEKFIESMNDAIGNDEFEQSNELDKVKDLLAQLKAIAFNDTAKIEA